MSERAAALSRATRNELDMGRGEQMRRWMGKRREQRRDTGVHALGTFHSPSRHVTGDGHNLKSLGGVEPPGPLHAQPWFIDMSKSHAMHHTT